MRPDDPTDPPAEVRPAAFADVLTALMVEAAQFGRRTVEAKVAAGRKLLDARAELDRRNADRPAKDRVPWVKLLARHGFSKDTARRLMTCALSHKQTTQLASPLDRIYDDGHDPAVDEGKKACRDCRVRGREFDPKCRTCRALNRPTPKPKEGAGPLIDGDGNPVPEHLVPVWQDAETIRQFNTEILAKAKAIKGIAERPAGRGVPADHFLGRLKGLLNTNYAYRPGFVCQDCGGQGCEKCGDGWFPDATVRQARAAAKARERAEQIKQSNQPLPE